MQTLQIPLIFQPEQAVQLRQAYTQLSNALETDDHFDVGQLRATLTEALEAQPAFGSDGFQRLHEQHSEQHLLHLSFADDRGNLLDLPWQLVADDSPHLLVSKGLPERGKLTEFKPSLPKPLKVLVMIAAPEGCGARLNYEAEEKVILDALAPLMRTGEVEVEFTDDGSLASLRRSLASNQFHVLHFSGHSVFTAKKFGETPEAYLLLEDEFSMDAQLTSAVDFAGVLNADPDCMPALVFLSSCQTGQSGKDGGFRGAAQRLMQEGVPAVVAMGWSVKDFWATHFARAFYEKIARRATLAEAFNQSLAEGRKVQRDWLPSNLEHTSEADLQTLFTAQSLIPQLFLTQQVVKLVDWGAPSEKRLSRTGLALLDGKNRLADKLKKIHAVFGRRDEWLFIGRRRERKAALAALRDGRSVLLRGQGGMGKTALALHLAQRQLVADSDGCVPFAFDQTSLNLEKICHALLDFLETDCRLLSMRTQLAAVEKLWNRFFLLLENVEKQKVMPLFLLDNLESFQETEGGLLNPEALELLDYLLNRFGYPVICTGRYSLQEFSDEVLHPVDLNQVPFGDFKQKCLHLPSLRCLEVSGHNFDETLSILHCSLGGNYRSLEDFDELCRNNATEAPGTLEALNQLIARYAGEALQNRAIDLVFGKLLALLTPAEATALALLAQFNRPVLPYALEWQPQSPGEAEPLCNRLADMT
ncbi:MAG: CHAT domain-containing protein, partial [Saprospiraceae bacterium]|nr:CHAT domain-containing protein [Saprospiraceae bacterium]